LDSKTLSEAAEPGDGMRGDATAVASPEGESPSKSAVRGNAGGLCKIEGKGFTARKSRVRSGQKGKRIEM
jgi:hypothetical protein